MDIKIIYFELHIPRNKVDYEKKKPNKNVKNNNKRKHRIIRKMGKWKKKLEKETAKNNARTQRTLADSACLPPCLHVLSRQSVDSEI